MKSSTTIISVLGAMIMSGVGALVQVWQLPPELVAAIGTIIAAVPAISERVKKGFGDGSK